VTAPPPGQGSGAQLDLDNPWPGLESYDESSTEFFSGRAAEADELQRRIVDEPMTVLFGKSGLGKTSLLKAGVFPRLRDKGLLPILLRLQVRPGTEPLIEQVRLALFDAFRDQEIEHPASRDGETLWEYLHRTGLEFWTRQNRLVRPVLVFDQFEELFTLGRLMLAAVAAFREDLADLAENRIPAALARRLENRPASEVGLDLQAMPYKVVMALREDFLADLEEWRPTIPSLRRNRMRLLPMGPEQALQAVCNERTNHLVAEPLARKIVAFLSSGTAPTDGDGSPEGAGLSVEPALLSLFCRGVNEHRKQEGKARFDEALLEGGKGTIVTDFYRTSLKDQPERVRRFIEEELITEHGFRNSYSADDALAHGFVTAKELEALINRHLLRHEHHLGTERIELTHDLLTKAVIDERDERRRAERSERERRERHRLWAVAGSSAVVVLIFAVVAYAALRAKSAALVARHEAVTARDDVEKLQVKTQEQVIKLELASDDLKKAHGKADEQAMKATKEAENARVQEGLANKRRDESRSKELAAFAETTMDKDPELAVLLALEGLRRAETTEARTQVLAAAQYAWPSAVLEEKALGGTPKAVALSADGSRLAVLAESAARREDRTITLWDVTLRKPKIAWDKPVEAASSLAFSPDQSLLAVVGATSIDLRNANTGDPNKDKSWPGRHVRAIAFSPDGRWLAWAQDDGIQLVDYRNEHAKVVTAPVKAVVGFAVVADGNRIIAVTNYPLSAQALDRQPDGSWAPPVELPLSACMKPQSVSPGAQYASATWKAQACASHAMSKDRAPFSPRKGNAEATSDIVWSAAGHAFAEILLSRDIIVGRSERFATQSGSRIKGTNPGSADDMSALISMSEVGTRLALIDRDIDRGKVVGKVVRVYSLADHKPFLSRFDEGSVAIAPDGGWIAVAKRLAPGEKDASGGEGAAVEVIPIEQAFASDYHSRKRRRIELAALPEEIYAAQSSVVAVLPQPVTTVVFDAVTRERRFDPQLGRAHLLGATGELLLLEPPGGEPWRLVRTKDGSPLAPWEQLPGADGPPVFRISAKKKALAVLRLQAASTSHADAVVYSVRGDSLLPAGRVIGLPAALLSARADLVQPADDARSIITVGKFVWPVTSGREPASARPLRAGENTGASASPSGRFEIQEESEGGAAVQALKVVRRADRSILEWFRGAKRGHRFSSDDGWLAVWSEDGIWVLDLARGELALDLNLGARSSSTSASIVAVNFEARNAILNVQFSDGTTMLIPLDRALTERFAKWLVPRELTPPERCRYGAKDEATCRMTVIAPRAQRPSQ